MRESRKPWNSNSLSEKQQNHETQRIPRDNKENRGNHRILHENHENHENLRIPYENQDNNKNHTIPFANHEHHENLRIPRENYENHDFPNIRAWFSCFSLVFHWII